MGHFINEQVVADVVAHCDENDQRAREQAARWLDDDVVPDRDRRAKYWEGVEEADVPPDYLHHFQSAQRRLARVESGMTAKSLRDPQSGYCFGDPDACIRVVEAYEAAGVEEMMLRLQVTPATTHEDAMNSLRLFGKYVIPHFREKERKSQTAAQQVGTDN